MSLFSNLTNDGLEEVTDRVGGFSPFKSSIYTGVLKAYYAGESKGGAKSISVIVAIDGKEYRETVYITNKKGENFFLNKDDKTKKVPLPGFNVANEIAMLTIEKPISELEFEEKVINLWDSEAKKELPKAVMMATEVLGKTITLGILEELHNKNEEKNGEWVATADTVTKNVIAKVFHTDSKMTMAEAINGNESAEFHDKWLAANKDKVVDRREIKDGQAGTAGKSAPKAGDATSAAPKKSLFGNKK